MDSLAIAVVVVLAVVALVLSTKRRARPETYVLVKGAEGFGDRMQCLLQAVRYAKRTARTLVVDWRDDHWCHDERTGFDEFFTLIGVRSASITDLAYALDDAPTVYPERWTPSAVVEPTRVSDLYAHDAFSESEPCTATCVVHPGVKYRAWRCADAGHVRARPWLAARVARVFAGLEGPYTAVHLRGGDRLARRVAETGVSRAEYVAALRARVEQSETVVLVSDDAGLVAEYTKQCVAEKAPVPRVSGLTPPAECVSRADAGTHLARQPDLACPWLTKRELNANAVCDFVVLAHAARVVADGESLFSQMARCVAYPAFGIRTRNR
jgi:hypothetical protein